MTLNLEGFQEIELTPKLENHRGDVYVLFFIKDHIKVPFYVGQTTRLHGRMDDYFWASFQAPTDFKVGTAIQYFRHQLEGRVVAKHKLCPDPRQEESVLLKALEEADIELPLLNWMKGYDYRTANIQEEVGRIHSKCDEIAAYAKASQHNLNQRRMA